ARGTHGSIQSRRLAARLIAIHDADVRRNRDVLKREITLGVDPDDDLEPIGIVRCSETVGHSFTHGGGVVSRRNDYRNGGRGIENCGGRLDAATWTARR